MFVDVKTMASTARCRIVAWGHTDPNVDDGFTIVDQATFIAKHMSEAGRIDLLGSGDYNNPEAIEAKAADWISKTEIAQRIFFSGTTAELGAIAARRCLDRAKISADSVDAIIGATNTGPGYPSLADYVKLSLGSELSEAVCFDVTEACTASAVAIFNAWSLIRSGARQCVLVVCAEKATTLTSPDNWIGANLFGDAAFAVVLAADSVDSFEFFYGDSLPFGGNINRVIKTVGGFKQDGPEVHKFVGRKVVPTVVQAVQQAGINPADIKHVIPHQPSGKTLTLFFSKLESAWPSFSGQKHQMVQNMGNLSSASTGYVISRQLEQGVIKSGDLVVVSTFGSGLSIFNYSFQA